MRIGRIINAAIFAVQDRRQVSKLSKDKTLSDTDKLIYDVLIKKTGESVHSPAQILKNWKKAYVFNMERLNMIAELNKPFEKPSLLATVIKSIFKK